MKHNNTDHFDDEDLSGDILMDEGDDGFLRDSNRNDDQHNNSQKAAQSLRQHGNLLVQEVLRVPGIESIGRLIGMIVGALLMISGFFDAFKIWSPSTILSGIHTACYGLLFILAELRWPFLLRQASFLTTYKGRAFMYIFVATGSSGDLMWLTSIVVGCLGVLNLILSVAATKRTVADDNTPPV